jgi:periplasmic mercuric ion binding protein
MKKLIISFTILCFSVVAYAQTEKVEIKTSANCGMCKRAIEKDLAFEKGVKSSSLDLKTKVVTVEYDSRKTEPDKIRQRITMVGYHADTLERNTKAYEKLPDCCKDGGH